MLRCTIGTDCQTFGSTVASDGWKSVSYVAFGPRRIPLILAQTTAWPAQQAGRYPEALALQDNGRGVNAEGMGTAE